MEDITRIAFSHPGATMYNNDPSLPAITTTETYNFCNARRFKGETSSICCTGGKVLLEPLPAPLPFLQELFSAESPMSKQFLAQINEYNGCFAMNSFGHQGAFIDGWNPSFRVKGTK